MQSQLIETNSLRLEPCLLVSLQAPEADVERIMAAVTRLAPLAIGRYDRNVFQSAAGIEYYRPLEGAVAGAEGETRRRPGIVEVSFQLPRDQELLAQVVEAVFQTHSYQEPLIVVREGLASRSKGLDDRDNPHRWWNTTGDWKKKSLSNA